MFVCYFCEKQYVNPLLLKIHLSNKHIRSGEWKLPFCCNQDNCKRTFITSDSWYRHVKRSHSNLEEAEQSTGLPCSQASFEEVQSFPETAQLVNNQANVDEETCSEQLLNGITISGASLVGKMLSSSSVTETSLLQMLLGVGHITESMVAYLKEITTEFVVSQAPHLNIQPLLEKFFEISNPVQCYSSERNIRNYFREQPEFVPPNSIIFGMPRFETKYGFDGTPVVKQLIDTWQYVPISETLKVLLSKKEIFERIRERKPRNDGILSDIIDGQSYATHPLFMDQTKTSVALKLYYDDVEMANPLGSKATLHKIGVFYYVIANLPPYFNSCMANIHVVALAYTGDLKKYGFKPLLAKLADEIQKLETAGIEITVDGRIQTIYASLLVFTGDNLGRSCDHGIFGFCESFSATYFCSSCMATRDSIQSSFDENVPFRTKQSYDVHLAQCLNDPSTSNEF